MTVTTTPTLAAPLYGASFGQAVSRFWSKYATFSGRASRSEFWFAYLFVVAVSAVLYGLSFGVGVATGSVAADGTTAPGAGGVVFGLVYLVWALATIIPFLAVTWRRLHDTNKSGGFYFLGLIPFVGAIIVIVLLALPSEPAGARFDR
ncbi:MAG: DUF805 domain-containing protein [Leifsonia sp.]